MSDRTLSSKNDEASSGAFTVDEESSQEMTADQLAEARRYGRVSVTCTLIDMAVDVAYLAAAAFWFGPLVDRWLGTFGALSDGQSYLRLAALFLIVIGLHYLVSLPLSFYSGFVIEHRFGLSNQSLGRWISNWLKSLALTVAFALVLNLLLYFIIWNSGGYWWLIAAAVFFAVSIGIGQLYPVLVMPLFYKVERLQDEELVRRVRGLAEEGGLAVEGVYRLGLSADTKKANAMLAGMGRTRRVLLGDTLLDRFSPDEIAVIFAHEMGHHVHRHLTKMLVQGAVLSILGFWLCNRLLVWWSDAPNAAAVTTDSLPVLMFAQTLFMLVLGPIQNAISRHFERQSDRYALAATGLRDAYRSAFAKLAKLNKDDPHPNPVEVFFLHSHPPISERLALADGHV
jgi:STE24 endopeptidase